MATFPPERYLRISQILPCTADGMAAISPIISERRRTSCSSLVFIFNRMPLNTGKVKAVFESSRQSPTSRTTRCWRTEAGAALRRMLCATSLIASRTVAPRFAHWRRATDRLRSRFSATLPTIWDGGWSGMVPTSASRTAKRQTNFCTTDIETVTGWPAGDRAFSPAFSD